MKFSLIPVFCLTLIFGCSTTDDVRDYINQQTNPFISKHINYAVFTEIIQNKPEVFLTFRFYRNELNFVQSDSGFSCKLTIHIAAKKNELETNWDTTYVQTYHFKSFDETRIPLQEIQTVKLNLSTGIYTVVCNLYDQPNNSDMKIQTKITVPSFLDSVQVSSIRFLDDIRVKKVSPTKQLSVRPDRRSGVLFEILNQHFEKPIRIQLKITRIKSDTLPARPMQSLTPLEGSIETRGYKLYEPQYFYIALDSVIQHSNNLTHRFKYLFPDSLTEGVYTAEINIKLKNQPLVTSPKELFYIFPDNYPETKTIREAVTVLKYLAYPNEYEDILSGGDEKLKENFDKFWLKLSNGNQEAAKKKIAAFYERVSESNTLFSTYKPGWKTDLGMIYILFGQPITVQWQPSSLLWYYYYRPSGGNIPLRFYPIRSDEKIMGYYMERYFEFDDLFVECRRSWERN